MSRVACHAKGSASWAQAGPLVKEKIHVLSRTMLASLSIYTTALKLVLFLFCYRERSDLRCAARGAGSAA